MGGVDIVVTHAPPYGLGDGDDPAHWGFESLVELLDTYHPQYLVHGHVHIRYGARERVRDYNGRPSSTPPNAIPLKFPTGRWTESSWVR